MTAIDLANRVIHWAMHPQGEPPRAPLTSAKAPSRATRELARALAELARITAARLRLAAPPLGDRRPIGMHSVLLAMVIGSEDPGIADTLFPEIPESEAPAEWVVRHGLVGPALRYLPQRLADPVRAKSPLTAVLDRPPEGKRSEAMGVVRVLLEDPEARRSLQLHLAAPIEDPEARDWRHFVMERLRRTGLVECSFVLGIYQMALFHHRREVLEQAAWAKETLEAAYNVFLPLEDGTPQAAPNPFSALNNWDPHVIRNAVSLGRWWEPLSAIERAYREEVRARRLGYDYGRGIDLFHLSKDVTRVFGRFL